MTSEHMRCEEPTATLVYRLKSIFSDKYQYKKGHSWIHSRVSDDNGVCIHE